MDVRLSLLGLSLLSLSSQTLAAEKTDTIRFIIKYKENKSSLVSLQSQITKTTHLPIKEMKPMANGAYSLILDGSEISTSKSASINKTTVLEQLRKNPKVQYVVQDRVGYIRPVPDPKIDHKLSQLLSHETQWDEFARPAGIMLESAPGLRDGAWAHTTGKSDKPIVVAVLDTGIALNDSLVNNLVKDEHGAVWGWNFGGNNNDLSDEGGSYHGTHVAGTIAAYGTIINGVGEDLKILPVKIPGADEMFYESNVINGIYWSVGGHVPNVPDNIHPAKVLNMSFSVDFGPNKELEYCDEALQEALFYARKKGAVIAVAAGNDNVWENYKAPALCNATIKVASTGPEGLRSYFSNYGPAITFAAPGGDKRYGTDGGILSTVNPGGGYNGSGFDFYQGTSMATPHVAGVAALVFAASDRHLKPQDVEQILYTTTHDFGKSSNENVSCVGKKPCGHGILDAENAVQAVLADYHVVFSAPKLSQLSVKECGTGMAKSSRKRIESQEAVWIPKESSCQPASQYQHPQIKQAKDGAIYAHYGKTSYQLDTKSFKHCQVIGYDGVGCYK